MIVLFVACLLSYVLLTGFAGYKAYQSQQLHLADTLLPIWIIACWSSLAAFGFGQQSLGNLIELPLLLFLTSLLYNFQVYLVLSSPSKRLLTRHAIYIVTLMMTITTRLFFPLIVE
ncbi:hypothetical protein MD535_21785 [Vibrio sp. ZSDZ65]|uniref:Uncharacterized protein n=1 Tax=Vibrio qingdaonensis TaxID=2829491 RepID=A0A9X3HYT8_9VIBR|nr:hypothetical protein [Vibrio qingdaonensis]MCW8348623.1 hypothetical protein [Vibrio qingdaonensis]